MTPRASRTVSYIVVVGWVLWSGLRDVVRRGDDALADLED